MMTDRSMKIIAGVLGFTGVGLGAFGAHALKAVLIERGMLDVWRTAVQYQMIHALGVLVLAVFGGAVGRWVSVAVWAWSAGVLLFSGSLYWLALGGPRWLGPVTPLGGVAFLLGWAAVVCAGLMGKSAK